MSKALRLIAALGAVLFAIVGLTACGGLPGNAVAKIDGGATITKTTFMHWMNVAAASSGEKAVVPEPPKYTACVQHLLTTEAKPEKGQKAPSASTLKSECAQEYTSLKQEVMGFLLSSGWVLAEAHSLGVKISDKEVHTQFNKIRDEEFPKSAEFEKFLSTSGQTVSDLLLRVKLNLLSQKIQQKIVKTKHTVSSAEVKKYYEQNKSKYGTAEKRDIEIILVKTEAQANSAKKEIESGKSFASVAKRVSIDPTSKAKGGYLPEVVKGEEEKELDEAVFSAKVNTLGGPIKTQFGYYLYEVKSIIPGTQKSLASVEKTIKQTLQSESQQKLLNNFISNFKKKWKAKSECRAAYVVADCKSYKVPKTKSGTTSTGASSTAE